MPVFESDTWLATSIATVSPGIIFPRVEKIYEAVERAKVSAKASMETLDMAQLLSKHSVSDSTQSDVGTSEVQVM